MHWNLQAEIAANENIPVLLFSGHAERIATFHRFGYPCRAKPCSLDQLLSESKRVIAEAGENIRRVKAAAARIKANAEALNAVIRESKRLVHGMRAKDRSPTPNQTGRKIIRVDDPPDDRPRGVSGAAAPAWHAQEVDLAVLFTKPTGGPTVSGAASAPDGITPAEDTPITFITMDWFANGKLITKVKPT
jgi:hypothetical protein